MKVIDGGFGKANDVVTPEEIGEDLTTAVSHMDIPDGVQVEYLTIISAGPVFGMTSNMTRKSDLLGALEATRITVDEDLRRVVRS